MTPGRELRVRKAERLLAGVVSQSLQVQPSRFCTRLPLHRRGLEACATGNLMLLVLVALVVLGIGAMARRLVLARRVLAFV